MRLIDIDAFYKFCESSYNCGHEIYSEYYDDYLESDMFEVKAIPIEWLKEHYGWLTMIGIIIDKWKEENDEN